MKQTFDFLKHRTQTNFLATINGDRPSCRPFCDPVLFDGRIYVLTQKHKDVSKQLASNNHACIVAYDGTDWIRINCSLVDDSENTAAKQAIIDEFDWAEEAGYTLDNPDFQILYLSEAEATIYDEDGNILAQEKF